MKSESSFGNLLRPAQAACSETVFANGPVRLRQKRCVYVNLFLRMVFQHAENEPSVPKEADYANEILVSDSTNHNRLSGYFPILMR